MTASPGHQAVFAFETLSPPAAGRLTAWNPAQWPVAEGWQPLVREFLDGATGRQLGAFVQARLAAGAVVYPPQPFRALELTAPQDVKAVILGQDPYHGSGQAEGLAFSVAPGVRLPPSLRNIFKELQREDGRAIPASGSLAGWARQGVLLLNTSLTVEDGQPASHAKQGWEVLTDAVIRAVSARPQPVVFMLWGAHAQAKRGLIDAQRHLVLTANHPSPLSALRPPEPFIGCGHFSRARAWLAERGESLTF
ncbi:uracil-DNA glycosylase [Variovorax terrae]|uniref:Uracil-DNA glycosylase n=1 Tax=Variovorax terrae TaxID=2923278 RepID=A0A9X1W1I7_9BURK|nr:uracil-DNA glycosylase [Variovorax terrae]MCJ0766094.1 uracil-DNA glycosylase [Variovorax terrae]